MSTSRDPSSRLVQVCCLSCFGPEVYKSAKFAKEVCLLFPNSQRINRGNYTTKEVDSVLTFCLIVISFRTDCRCVQEERSHRLGAGSRTSRRARRFGEKGEGKCEKRE